MKVVGEDYRGNRDGWCDAMDSIDWYIAGWVNVNEEEALRWYESGWDKPDEALYRS